MNVFNRPPSIADDTVQYALHPAEHSTDPASVTALAAIVQESVDALLPHHIWHRDPFQLKLTKDDGSDACHLTGRMRVGDAVDDEWLLVWLLKEISSRWDLVISIIDTDGEFLLIEAAESLPSWVTPTNAENRVWIYNSRLHLVPISHVSTPRSRQPPRRRPPVVVGDSDDEGDVGEDFLSVQDALRLVRDGGIDTYAPIAVQDAVWAKVEGYPALVRDHLHTAKVHLPQDVARTLIAHPHLIQRAIEAFYTRDAIQLRAAQKMARFPPEPDVLTTARMTRTAFAQLVGQKFHHPKVFGNWLEKEGTREWTCRDVGMKIACGFEMLYQESKGQLTAHRKAWNSATSDEARKDALQRSPDYREYIKRLISASYFKGELEGSLNWKALESKAAAAFVEARKDSDVVRVSFAVLVDAALVDAGNLSVEPMHPEESDSWLQIDSNNFEDMLQTRANVQTQAPGPSSFTGAMEVDADDDALATQAPEEAYAQEQAKRLKDLAGKVETFMEGKGDLEGARFDDDLLSDEEFNEEDSDESMNSVQEESEGLARQRAMENLVPALSPEEYGKMPASFYSNSQTTASAVEEEEDENKPDGSATTTTSHLPLPDPTTAPISDRGEQRQHFKRPIFTRDQYDGVVDSDDESDPDDPNHGIMHPSDDEEESDEDRPQVVGDVDDIDMSEEQEDFIRFSQEALGLSEAQFSAILRDRAARGATIPKGFKVHDTPDAHEVRLRPPAPGPRPNRNPNLDSFEAVMTAMDTELSRVRKSKTRNSSSSTTATSSASGMPPNPTPSTVPPPVDKGKGKQVSMDGEDNDGEDVESLMDEELHAALNQLGGSDDEDDDGDGGGESAAASVDYNLIRNFLESFKSQGGLPGPVSTLAGRLQPGWKLPRDAS